MTAISRYLRAKRAYGHIFIVGYNSQFTPGKTKLLSALGELIEYLDEQVEVNQWWQTVRNIPK